MKEIIKPFMIGVVLGILILASIGVWNHYHPEKIDYLLVIDSELEDDYLSSFILKSQIHDFNFKIAKPLENLDDYSITTVVLCASGNDTFLTFDELNYSPLELANWLEDLRPSNLILDVDFGNSFKSLVSKMNIYASSNLTLKVELLENIYDYKWSFLGSWLKNYEANLEKTFNKVMMDGLIARKAYVGSTGVGFWKSQEGSYKTYWSA